MCKLGHFSLCWIKNLIPNLLSFPVGECAQKREVALSKRQNS